MPDGIQSPAHIPGMGPGLTAGLGGPTRPRRDAERYRYRRHACASVVLACIACVPKYMKRLRADFRTPATRRECRAAVAADAMTARGTAAAAASAVVAADAVSPPSAAVHVVAARASCTRFARRGGTATAPRRSVPVSQGQLGDRLRCCGECEQPWGAPVGHYEADACRALSPGGATSLFSRFSTVIHVFVT